jgi:hypothetical protein
LVDIAVKHGHFLVLLDIPDAHLRQSDLKQPEIGFQHNELSM